MKKSQRANQGGVNFNSWVVFPQDIGNFQPCKESDDNLGGKFDIWDFWKIMTPKIWWKEVFFIYQIKVQDQLGLKAFRYMIQEGWKEKKTKKREPKKGEKDYQTIFF